MSVGESKTLDYNVRIRDAPSDATATKHSVFPRLQVKRIHIRQTKESPRSQLGARDCIMGLR